MFCSNCGNEMVVKDIFCSLCGTKKMTNGNSISSGARSINTIGSQIIDSPIHIGDSYDDSNNIDADVLNIKRHLVNLPWSKSNKLANSSSISKLGTWGSLASIVGLLLPYLTSLNYLPHFFLIGLAFSLIFAVVPITLKRSGFTHLWGLKNLEVGTKNGIYLSKITCDCPWCESKMKLYNAGPKEHKQHTLVCQRNSSQHRILFDHTVLPDIEE